MKTAVQFDVDGVLVDFVKGYLKLAQVFGYTGDVLGDADNVTYGTQHLVGAPTNAAVWSWIKRSLVFWEELPANDMTTTQTFTRINALQDARDVYFATNRPGLNARWQTVQWLQNRGIDNPTVVVTDRKGEFARVVKAGWSIEDKAGNAVYIAYESPDTRSVILDRPYNRFDSRVVGSKVLRVFTVDEFLTLVEGEDA